MQDIWWFLGTYSQLWAHNCRYLNQLSVQTDCKAEILPHQLARISLCSFHPVLVYHYAQGGVAWTTLYHILFGTGSSTMRARSRYRVVTLFLLPPLSPPPPPQLHQLHWSQPL